VASDASCTIGPGEAVTVTLDASDGDGDSLSFIIASLPSKGTLSSGSTSLTSSDLPYTISAGGDSITFTADSDEHGTDTFQFKANDGTGDSNTATVSIVINQPPAQTDNTFSTQPNADLTITLPAEDPDGDTLSYVIAALPGHGRLTSGSTTLTDDDLPLETATADLTYSPDANYHGHDCFDFTATDGTEGTGTITVEIEINTAPVPDDISTTVLPDGTTTIQLTSTDADRDPVRYRIISLPTHGTLDAGGAGITDGDLPLLLDAGETTVTYTVDAGYQGTDSFHYRVQDDVAASDRAVVTIVVNTPPVSPAVSLTGTENGTVEGVLTPTDADGDSLVVRITRLPGAGTLKIGGSTVTSTTTEYSPSGSDLSFVYTPDGGMVGEDSFDWVANDGKEDSTPGTVTITVNEDPSQENQASADENSSDDASQDGEEVLAEAPSEPVTGLCGLLVFEPALLMLMLLLIPRRVFLQNNRGLNIKLRRPGAEPTTRPGHPPTLEG